MKLAVATCPRCKGLLGVSPLHPLACVSVRRGGCPARERTTARAERPPLTGPGCGCGGPGPRKRGWMPFDRAACPRCGQVYEYVIADAGRVFRIVHPAAPFSA